MDLQNLTGNQVKSMLKRMTHISKSFTLDGALRIEGKLGELEIRLDVGTDLVVLFARNPAWIAVWHLMGVISLEEFSSASLQAFLRERQRDERELIASEFFCSIEN